MAALEPVLRTTRIEVRKACELLVSPSPEALDACAGVLESAVATLSGGHDIAAGPEALDEAFRLRTAIRTAARLLQGAADYHSRWLQVLGTLTAGYTARGEPAPIARQQRISLSG